ncbi:MAG: hypothetical protein CM1200mP20_09620 [Pseudomonadota bacterium]|nr:MAG: hypothetical protein CM1200mP20_09620 [Pseudomonadota bacterium]
MRSTSDGTSSVLWVQRGQPVALAVTLRTWGSAPKTGRSPLAISDSGQFEGSVSGGCVENAVIEEAGRNHQNGCTQGSELGSLMKPPGRWDFPVAAPSIFW